MAKVICSDNITNFPSINHGDFVLTSNGWGIVGWGGEENGKCVYYLSGIGYDEIRSVDVEKVIASDKAIVKLELIES